MSKFKLGTVLLFSGVAVVLSILWAAKSTGMVGTGTARVIETAFMVPLGQLSDRNIMLAKRTFSSSDSFGGSGVKSSGTGVDNPPQPMWYHPANHRPPPNYNEVLPDFGQVPPKYIAK